jgi:hypothetical protein
MDKRTMILLVGVVGGCAATGTATHGGEASSAPEARGGGPKATSVSHTSVPVAAEAFAAEACAFQERCGRVGDGRQFTNGEACRTGIEETAIHGLSVCQKGVDSSLLVTCMEQVRAKSCTADVMSACRYAELCAR